MKTKLLLILLIVAVGLPLIAAPPGGRRAVPSLSAVVDNGTYINANKILMFVTNHGNFARDLSGVFGQDAGTFYPYTTNEAIESGAADDYVVYASGLWVGGQVGGETRVIISEFSDEYVPGPMIGGTFDPAHGTDPAYRVYKLYSDSLADNPNQDYEDWPMFTEQNAPWMLDNIVYDIDSSGIPWDSTIVTADTVPAMIGDQMLWSVFNDADPDQHSNSSGETAPLGLEVRQTVFAFDREDPLGEVIFMRIRVYNEGGNTIENCYLSLWADPDLGEYTDDLVGCDTTLSLGFVYNSDNDDAGHYTDRPPSVGFDFFQGPLQYTGDMADTAKMWGEYWPGYTNMGMVSFNKYINGTDPNSFDETYNYMRGLGADGSPYVYNGQELLYMHSGDPVAGVGDLDFDPADRRWMQSAGPITFAPGDSTEIVAAIIVGHATNRLTSVSLMKYHDRFAQLAYDRDFDLLEPPATPIVTVAEKDQAVILSWTDTSEVDHGTYDLEGYLVYQGETPSGPWTKVAAFDYQNFTEDIFDEVFDPVTSVPEIRLKKDGDESGISHYIYIDQDYIMGGPIHNMSEYHYRVEAYSFNPDADLGLKTLESADVVSAIPQRPIADYDYDAIAGDTLAVTQVSGGSDGVVTPIVAEQAALTGHEYQVSFLHDTTITYYAAYSDTTWEDSTTTDTCDVEWDTLNDSIIVIFCDTQLVDTIVDHTDYWDTTIATYWRLHDLDLDSLLLDSQYNLSGDNVYDVVDGVFLKVAGPEIGINTIQEVADATGPIDPDNVAYSLNSTGDWYVSSDQGSNFARMNWRGYMGTYDWEFRFTADSSEYYDWDTDDMWGNLAPFEVWNIGIGTPEDDTDDMRIGFFILDDDGSGGWSWGDRIYTFERQYSEPNPDPADYTWDDDFWLGRVVFNLSGGGDQSLTAPDVGTVVRFTSRKVITLQDVYTFETSLPTVSTTETVLDNITVAPNPFYLYGPYDPAIGNYHIEFQNLPGECNISIYNLAGDFIRRIEKNTVAESHIHWDALSANGLPVASGIYLYVVDAPGIGQKIGKIAVFTEVEVLTTY